MRTSANKSSKPGGTVTRANDKSFFGGTRSSGFFAPVMRQATGKPTVQTKLAVSKPGDPLEKEADRNSERVMRMADASPVQRKASDVQIQRDATPIQRAAGAEVQRFGIGGAEVDAGAQSALSNAASGGRPLSSDVRHFMEPRFGADLERVRVHDDATAHSLSSQFSARAFTYQNHVFFGRDQYQPSTNEGRHLLAHELTHTMQQGAVVQRDSIQNPKVTTSASPPAVQRWGIDDVLDWFADKASYIPGYRMLTLILGFNPINMRSVDRTAANFLRALIELVPGGRLITQVLDTHGVINKAADWVEQKVAALGDIGGQIGDGLKRFLDSLGWTDILHPGDVWDRAKRIFTDPIDRLIDFGVGVVSELLDLVKQAILRPLAALAEGTRGYDLLKAILRQDPITGQPFPRTADTLIGGFMKLIGQEEIWENIKKGNAVARAWAWFQGALEGLMAFVTSIPGRIIETLRSLTFQDVITVVGAFQKIGSAFLDIAGRFFSWAGQQVLSLLEILFSVVAPRVMPYIAKAKAAFNTILKNPIGFVGNLVRAGKLGFQRFAENILDHLKNALIAWLTGPLGAAGVYIPKSFSLLEIIKLVLSVLGLTWQNIRSKLIKIIPDPVLTALEKTASILVTLATQGPAAAWEQIKAELTELKDQLIGKVTDMIQMEVVKAAVKKLAMMLNPAGAVIQAIIAIYNTVTFFIEKIEQIGAVVASFIDSIAAIAAGQVENAAKKVEQTMARTLVTVLAFLAKFAGLGGIPDKLVGIVKKIRAPIDKALDKIVDWLGKMLQKLVGAAKAAAKKFLQWWKVKLPIAGGDESHTLTYQGEGKAARLVVLSTPQEPIKFLEDQGVKLDPKVQPLLKKINDLQNELGDIDDEKKPKAAARKEPDKLSKQLNDALADLADLIGKALGGEKTVEDALGKKKQFVLSRFRFEADVREEFREEAIAKRERTSQRAVTAPDAKKLLNLEGKFKVKGFARRHVVSSADMADHYPAVLKPKKLSAAKLLLEQSGSIPEARAAGKVQGTKPNLQGIIAAATNRYQTFFGWVRNLFLGPQGPNAALGRRLDPEHPEMTTSQALENHVSRVKRSWALDSSFSETR